MVRRSHNFFQPMLVRRPTASHAAASDIVSRAVEAGSQLLAAPPDDVRVVMQMPRGNLETVAPRVLVLAAMADSLQVRRVRHLLLEPKDSLVHFLMGRTCFSLRSSINARVMLCTN